MCERCEYVAKLLKGEGQWAINKAIRILEGGDYEPENSKLEDENYYTPRSELLS